MWQTLTHFNKKLSLLINIFPPLVVARRLTMGRQPRKTFFDRNHRLAVHTCIVCHCASVPLCRQFNEWIIFCISSINVVAYQQLYSQHLYHWVISVKTIIIIDQHHDCHCDPCDQHHDYHWSLWSAPWLSLIWNLDAEMAAAVLGEFGSRGTVGCRLLGLWSIIIILFMIIYL